MRMLVAPLSRSAQCRRVAMCSAQQVKATPRRILLKQASALMIPRHHSNASRTQPATISTDIDELSWAIQQAWSTPNVHRAHPAQPSAQGSEASLCLNNLFFNELLTLNHLLSVAHKTLSWAEEQPQVATATAAQCSPEAASYVSKQLLC